MHVKEIDVKNGVYNYYFNNMVNAKELGTKNIFIDGKSYKGLVIFLLDMFITSQVNMLSLHYHE